jgi:hypothetical protein
MLDGLMLDQIRTFMACVAVLTINMMSSCSQLID